jgi:hypothetical protein
MVGLGKDSDDTNLQFMTNDSSGTATRQNTGIVPSVNSVYRISIFTNTNCTRITLTLEEITRTSSAIVASHQFTTNLPTIGNQSYPMVYVNSVATTTATTVDIITGYEELLTL